MTVHVSFFFFPPLHLFSFHRNRVKQSQHTQSLQSHYMTDRNAKTNSGSAASAQPAPLSEASELSGSDSELPAPPPFAPDSLPTTPTAATEPTQSAPQTTTVRCKPFSFLFAAQSRVACKLLFFFSLFCKPQKGGLNFCASHDALFVHWVFFFSLLLSFTGKCDHSNIKAQPEDAKEKTEFVVSVTRRRRKG